MTILQRGYKGFSLAEMLLVLLIMSFLSMAIAPFVTKKFKKNTLRIPHGRFECFYNDLGQLTQYTVYEVGRGTEENRSGQGFCEFTPPSRASFFLIQAVAGGGGGAYPATGPHITSYRATYSSYGAGYSYDGYYIPCSRVRSSYNSACSGTISRFTDSTNQANTHQMWEWVNEIWEDPKYTPKRSFRLCSGGAGGGEGIGGFVRTEVYQKDENGNYVLDADGNYIDTCKFTNVKPIIPSAGGEDEDPCHDYPTAGGGNGGDGYCITVDNVTLPLESTINRSYISFGTNYPGSNGYEAYATYGNVSCNLSQPQSGQNGKKDIDGDGYSRGADGASSIITIHTDDGAHTCDYTPSSTVHGGLGNDGGIWKSVNGIISFKPSPGQPNSNNSFTFTNPRNSSYAYYVPISYTYKKAYNFYGVAGGAGEYRMMFFPELKKTVRIVPGRRGVGGTGTSTSQQGRAGSNTTARFEDSSQLFMNLAGGRGGTVRMSGMYFQLYSQAPVYLNDVSLETSRVGKYSDFVVALSTDEGSNMQSVIPREKRPGRGGDGGYTVLRDTRNGGTREFDGHTFSSSGNDGKYSYGGESIELPTTSNKEITCHESPAVPEDQKIKISGATTVCRGEDGEDGAVVIIW